MTVGLKLSDRADRIQKRGVFALFLVDMKGLKSEFHPKITGSHIFDLISIILWGIISIGQLSGVSVISVHHQSRDNTTIESVVHSTVHSCTLGHNFDGPLSHKCCEFESEIRICYSGQQCLQLGGVITMHSPLIFRGKLRFLKSGQINCHSVFSHTVRWCPLPAQRGVSKLIIFFVKRIKYVQRPHTRNGFSIPSQMYPPHLKTYCP